MIGRPAERHIGPDSEDKPQGIERISGHACQHDDERHAGIPRTGDTKEIDEGRFWSLEEIEAALGKGLFTPNFEGEYNKLKAFKQ